jgi:hypothetical protein
MKKMLNEMFIVISVTLWLNPVVLSDAFNHLIIAITRNGPPLPPLIFIGSAMT